MKTPDEIKKGLECCSSFDSEMCLQCPYDDGHVACCLDKNQDALAYIKQLEQRLAQAEREMDAAVKDLADACKYCKHISCDDEDENSPCKDCMQRKGGVPFGPMIRTRFEWRGVCPENTKEDKNG